MKFLKNIMSMNLKGFNFFTSNKINEKYFKLLFEDLLVFDIEINNLNNVSSFNNELNLEFKNKENFESLEISTMNFFCPPINSEDNFIMNKINDYSFYLENKLKKNLKSSSKLEQTILILEDLPFTVPRGKYNCEIKPINMIFHGKTFNFIIKYQSIQKLFLLPDELNNINYVLISLNNPIKLGKTIYKNLIIQFKNEKEYNELEFNLDEENLKINNINLNNNISGKFFEVFAQVMKGLTGLNIIIPGDFKSNLKENYLKCNVAANHGKLYILNRSLIFIKIPVIYIKLDDILKIEFQRITRKMVQREFDIEVFCKTGNTYNFCGINKANIDLLMHYFEKNKWIFYLIDEDQFEINDLDEYKKEKMKKEEEYKDESFIKKSNEYSISDSKSPEKND